MPEDTLESSPTATTAANWLARLNTTTVSAKTMDEFRDWRAQPGNHEAFQEVAQLWAKSAQAKSQPGVQAALDAALDRRAPRRPNRFGLGLAIATAMVTVSIGGYVTWRTIAAPYFDTGVGEQRLVQLSDGSSVRLDTNSKITVRYSQGARRIALTRGQAFFEVAHDSARPFLVETPQATVRAIGTRFSVREGGATTQVTLVQGRIEVRDGDNASPRVLTAGEQIVATQALGPVRKVDARIATSWTTGRLVFHGVPLQQALVEMNRYSRKPIRLDPAYDQTETLTGAFDSADTEAMVAAVASLRGLSVEHRPDGSILLRQRPDA
ncbi:iron dicitrate transport regulator FecR [Caulobacter flavus]|jgi:transmembrane sensor|uniref:Iron dicitrate transport regulator FecR n=1 Tax=Caulobacter flavus TaxID=1679497 RepID=A0A2N5CL38_9CAUL|nr:FecR family protein [Caulobacter flavus]AYV48269.1 iron dicitrate transport regulator FecR [Caulobacter flavus]PLR06429.1 iron dicitrate transport regulator FecR [Caulobacter flavus]